MRRAGTVSRQAILNSAIAELITSPATDEGTADLVHGPTFAEVYEADLLSLLTAATRATCAHSGGRAYMWSIVNPIPKRHHTTSAITVTTRVQSRRRIA